MRGRARERWGGIEGDRMNSRLPKGMDCQYRIRIKIHRPVACVPTGHMHSMNPPWYSLEFDQLALSRPVSAIITRRGEVRGGCGRFVTAVVASPLRGGFAFHGFDHEKEPRVCYRYDGPSEANVEWVSLRRRTRMMGLERCLQHHYKDLYRLMLRPASVRIATEKQDA